MAVNPILSVESAVQAVCSEAPSFDRPNANYRVYFNDVETPVVHNDCQAGGTKSFGSPCP